MAWLSPIKLVGRVSALEPLSHSHIQDLKDTANDGELWKLWYTGVPHSDQMHSEIDRRLKLFETGSMLPFSVVDLKSEKVVGMTTYMNISAPDKRLEIGSTWYGKTVQGTAVNTDCKLLLLRYAFEDKDCNVVEFRTTFHNFQSRKNVEALGAKLDGILRNHNVLKDGNDRDACVYSIIKNEWPITKTHLEFRLEKKLLVKDHS